MTSSKSNIWFPLGPLAHEEPGTTGDLSAGKSRFARLASAGQEALGRLRAGSPVADDSGLLQGFATANSLTFHDTIEGADPERSLVLTSALHEVMTTNSGPMVEFGNHGNDRWYQPDQRPTRRGYIAMQHGLQMPHFFVRSSTPSPMTSGRFAAGALDAVLLLDLVTGAWEDLEEGKPASRLTRFIASSPSLKDFPAKVSPAPGKRPVSEFRVHVPKQGRASGAAFAKGVAAPLLYELGPKFDLEIRDEWLFAYACDGDLVTTDPARWTWAMATASRMLEFTHHMISVQGTNRPDWNLTDVAFYTPERVQYVAPPEG